MVVNPATMDAVTALLGCHVMREKRHLWRHQPAPLLCAPEIRGVGCENRLESLDEVTKLGETVRSPVDLISRAPLVRLPLPLGPKGDRPMRLGRQIGFLTNE